MLVATTSPSRPAPRPSRRGVHRRGLVAGAALLAVAAAAGCGQAPERAAAPSAEATEYAQRRHGATGSSPLADALGASSKQTTALERETMKRREEAIASCMRAQGFEYVPNVDVATTATDGDTDGGELTEREFAERWGYGWYTVIDTDGRHVDGAPPMPSSVFDHADDPNQAIRERMSEGERAAYDAALNGTGAEPATGGPGATSATDGCVASSEDTSGQRLDRMYDALGTAVSDVGERVAADRREKAALAEYRSCMRAAGSPMIRTPDDPQTVIDGMATNLFGEDAIDPKRLHRIQAFERRLAVAELPCRGHYEVVHERLVTEYEQKYLTDNRQLIDSNRIGG